MPRARVNPAWISAARTLRQSVFDGRTCSAQRIQPAGTLPGSVLSARCIPAAVAKRNHSASRLALRLWLGDPSLDVVGDREPARIDELGDHRLHVALPLRWVADVWGRDLAIVAGRFSLSVLEASPQAVLLETVGSDVGPPRPLRIGLLDA